MWDSPSGPAPTGRPQSGKGWPWPGRRGLVLAKMEPKSKPAVVKGPGPTRVGGWLPGTGWAWGGQKGVARGLVMGVEGGYQREEGEIPLMTGTPPAELIPRLYCWFCVAAPWVSSWVMEGYEGMVGG